MCISSLELEILVPNLKSFFVTKVLQKVLVAKYGCILLQVVELSQFVHYFRIFFYEPIKVPLIEVRYFVYVVYDVWVEKDMRRSTCSSCYGTYFKRDNSGVSNIIKDSHFWVRVCIGYFLIIKTCCSHLCFLIVERYTHFCSSKVHIVPLSISFVAHQSMAALSYKSLTIIFSTECERKSTWTVIVWWTVTAIQWWLWTMWGRIATPIPKTTKGCH